MPPGRPALKTADTVIVPPGPAARSPGAAVNLPERQEASRRSAGSYRKIAIGIAAVVLLAIAAFILMGNPGLPGGTSENASEPGLLGALPLPAIMDTTEAAEDMNPEPATELNGVINEGSPVFSDSPLDPEEI